MYNYPQGTLTSLLYFYRFSLQIPTIKTVSVPNDGMVNPKAIKKLVRFLMICSAPSESPVTIMPATLFVSIDFPVYIISSWSSSNLSITLCISED